MNEHQIQNDILREFGTRSDLRLWRANVGIAHMGNRTVSFGLKGQADLSGILPDGRRLEIEVKSDTGRQREEQLAFQAHDRTLRGRVRPRAIGRGRAGGASALPEQRGVCIMKTGPIHKENQPGVVIENEDVFAPPGTVGIELVKCPGTVIRNCTVNGGRTCIQADHCDDLKVIGNKVGGFATTKEEEGHGIQLRNCLRASVQQNEVIRSVLGEDGINFWYSSGEVRLNRIYRHGHSTAGNAITMDKGSHDVLIAGNRCWKQGQRDRDRSRASGTSSNRMRSTGPPMPPSRRRSATRTRPSRM